MNKSYPIGEDFAFQKSTSINPAHLAEWVEGSAVSEAIARLNIESLSAGELNERIRPGEPIKDGGWWCRGVMWRTGEPQGDTYGQGKPDRPHQPEGSKPRKYLTASGLLPDAIFLSMPDRDYWFKVWNDRSATRLWTEGVKKAGAGLTLGLPTIALTGVWNWGKDGELACFVKSFAQSETNHIIGFDSDYATKPECRTAILKFGRLLEKEGCSVKVAVWDARWKGMDDYIKANGGDAFKEVLANAVPLKQWEKQTSKRDRKSQASDSDISFPPARTRKNIHSEKYNGNLELDVSDAAQIEKSFTQKAEEALYSDARWVSVGGRLYKFTGTYYELQSEAEERRRIGGWLNDYSEKVRGRYVHNRATSRSTTEAINWVTDRKGVDPNKINPDGLNCTNGIVTINPDGSHTFAPHNPDRVYTYVGCKYDPDADATDCDRLLECLTPLYREVFLRTAAAALAVKLVRKKIGRKLKGLLCYGDGNNGKDTLRVALAAVLGRGMTGKTLSDFKAYDSGRKFTLAGIEESLCNWSSENASKINIDSLQSLKQVITGDQIDIERKGKDSFPCNPSAIFLANCNKLPSITGGMEAITSRYSILKFEKTFKVGADPSKGELEADPRYKDDPEFIRDRIAPALLNKMLERLPLVLAEGIDHSATEEAMQEAREESRHLWGFVREMGIEAQSGGRIYIKDLWEQLQQWYVETGILDIDRNGDKQKLVWNDLPNEWDKPVKAVNQIYARLCELFPKLEKRRHTEGSDSDPLKGQYYLLGIGVQNSKTIGNIASLASLPCNSVDIASLSASRASLTASLEGAKDTAKEAETFTASGSEAIIAKSEAIIAKSEAIIAKSEAVNDAAKNVKTLAASGSDAITTNGSEAREANFPIPAAPIPTKTKTFEMGDRVTVGITDRAQYRGAKGRIVDVWFTHDRSGYTVEFDEPVCGFASAEFAASELMEL